MTQPLRHLALVLSMATALAGVQLGVQAGPAHAASMDWPPLVATSGICEDGADPYATACPFRIVFPGALAKELTFFATTQAGSALPERDYISLDRVEVTVPAGTKETAVEVRIVSDGRCERPETFTLALSTRDPEDKVVTAEATITDTAC